MEELGDRSSRLIGKPQSSLKDFPVELIHLIQSYNLDPKEAARTCILSKSWLHAWFTIPTLRFRQQIASSVAPIQRANHFMMVDRTLQRYFQDNIPFETIDLTVDVNDQVSNSLAERWIRPVATRTGVKELSLTVNGKVKAPYTLPGEIFSNENIRKISIQSYINKNLSICSNNPMMMMIKCVSLRVLELGHVNISEEVLDKLLSTCSLLEELKLVCCPGLNTIKVRNLRYLSKLRISTYELDNLEICHVPNLACFNYHSLVQQDFRSYTVDSLASVTELVLSWVFIDKAVLDMINYVSLRVLELGNVNITQEALDNLISTCSLLEKLKLTFYNSLKTIKVKNLRYLCKLMIEIDNKSVNMEIHNVPKLSYFKYYSNSQSNFHSLTKDTLASVTELWLAGVIIDEPFLDMIKLNFRLLQN